MRGRVRCRVRVRVRMVATRFKGCCGGLREGQGHKKGEGGELDHVIGEERRLGAGEGGVAGSTWDVAISLVLYLFSRVRRDALFPMATRVRLCAAHAKRPVNQASIEHEAAQSAISDSMRSTFFVPRRLD